MTRKELYNEIKSLGLQDEVKAVTGDNYTRATNAQLQAIVNNAVASLKPVGCEVALQFNKLVEILAKKKILLKSEVSAIMNA